MTDTSSSPVPDRDRRTVTGYAIGTLSVVTNVVVFVAKYWVGIQSGSVAILADAWHTMSDSLSSAVVLAGFKAASKPADREHPFGHGRAELIAALIIGILLAFVGFNFLVESVQRLLDQQAATYGLFAVLVVGASVLAKEALAQISIRAGRRHDSPVLVADGWHHRSDAASSLLIVLAMVFGQDLWWIDGALGVLIALLLFHATWDILRGAVSSLLGEDVDEETLESIATLSRTVAGREVDPHRIRQHVYGQHRELTLHIRLPADVSLAEAHDVAHRLEHAIRLETGMEPTVHVDPVAVGD
jgi:cation diffusion facilitator family transporter